MPTTYAIPDGRTVMAASLYTGDGTSTRALTNTVNGVSFQPDLVWIKNRSAGWGHRLSNSVVGANYALESNNTAAELYQNQYGYLASFNSNGFTVQIGATDDYYTNNTGDAYVAWQWKAGGSSSSNTNGSITSTVSVGATQGFSVVTYTGTGANATVGHGLGVAPSMIILKSRVSATNWVVYHANLTSAAYVIQLNLTNAQSSSPTIFNSTAPTSSVFSIGTSSASNDTSMVAYCFAAVKGFSAFGSYTGNGSTDGPFVFTGFQPRWVMIKRTDSSPYNWVIGDTSRNTYNVANAQLSANLSDAENTSYMLIDFVSNGFKLRTTDGAYNASGGTYVYACFASNPFKYANAR